MSSFIKFVLDKPWDWYGLSINPNITMNDVKNNPDKPWNYIWLSSNPNVTMNDVKNNPDKPWNWDELSNNKFKYDKSLQKVQYKKLKIYCVRIEETGVLKNKMKYKRVFSHRSQDFWRWYCGEGGIGRRVDVMRSGCK